MLGFGIGGAKILSRALLNCHQAAAEAGPKFALEKFTSSHNRLENKGAKAMAEVFEVLGTLTHVSMTQNGINHPGISTLAKALAKNTNLQVLDLNDNTFTAKGAAAVAKLKVINFGDCLLRSDGAKEIAQAIQEHLPNFETNVELIRQVLEAKEHEGILDTLSDDEGDGEDEDEQEDDSKPDNDEPSEEVPATTGSNNA